MDKKTQLYVGIGAAAVIGYLLLKKKPKPVVVVNYAGTTTTDVVGRVQRADGVRPKPKTVFAPKTEKLQVTQSIFSADGFKPRPRTIFAPKTERIFNANGVNCDPVLDINCSKRRFKPTKSFFDVKDSKFGW